MKKDLYTKILEQKHLLEDELSVRKYIAICNLLDIYDKHPLLAKEVKAKRSEVSIHDPMKGAITAYMSSTGINRTKYGLLYRHLRFNKGFDISYPMLKKVLHSMPNVKHLGHAKGWALKTRGDISNES